MSAPSDTKLTRWHWLLAGSKPPAALAPALGQQRNTPLSSGFVKMSRHRHGGRWRERAALLHLEVVGLS
jgi:hypothetical protein